MNRGIIAPRAQNCKRIFYGWTSVPKEYKTRAAWKRQFSKVSSGEKPSAVVIIEQTRRLESIDSCFEVEKRYNLYLASQTQPICKTPLALARREFYEHFGRHANRNSLIRWTKGEWRTDEDGESYWDGTGEACGWRTYQEHFSLDRAIDHLNGKDIYGVFGAQESSYLLIDLDLHNQRLDLFLRRFRVLLDAFQGKHRCHFQVSDETAGGVHIILFFGKPSPLATRRKWLLNELARLDEEHPGVNFTVMKGGKRVFNVEVYPDSSKAHRLPLCRGRTMLLDKPLPLVTRHGRQVQDVVGYVNWLHDEDRQYMDKQEVLDFVVEKLDLACAADGGEAKTREIRVETKRGSGKTR